MTARPCAVNADKPAGQAEGLSDPPEASKGFGAEEAPRYQAEQKPLPPTLTKGMSFPAPRALAAYTPNMLHRSLPRTRPGIPDQLQ